jgi:ankyrin repeat protein
MITEFKIFESTDNTYNMMLINYIVNDDYLSFSEKLDVSKIKITSKTRTLINPLFYSINKNKTKYTKLLIDNNVYLGKQGSDNFTALIYSTINPEYTKMLKLILKHSKEYINDYDDYGYTALMALFEDNKLNTKIFEYIRILIDAGADPFFINNKNNSLFHLLENYSMIDRFFNEFPELKKKYDIIEKRNKFNI